MKKITLTVLIFCVSQNLSFAQHPPNACNEDPDWNPYGLGPLNPQWFFDHPYQIYTACPQIFVGLGEIDPKYLLDDRTGTGRFKNVKSETVQTGFHKDNYNNNPQQPYPGSSVINGYGDGQINLFELGSVQTSTS